MKEALMISQQAASLTQQFIQTISKLRKLSPRTLREYQSDMRHFMHWLEKEFPVHTPIRMEKLLPSTIHSYRTTMQETMGLKPATINRRLITLKQFFEWAHSEAIVKRDPSLTVKLIPEEKTSPRQITDAEEETLLAAVLQHGSVRDQTIMLVMLSTGLRPMEVCNLLLEDILIQGSGNALNVREGLRHKSRHVPLTSPCVEQLEKYVSILPPDSDYLFGSEKTGSRLSERALRHLVQKYTKAAGLEGLRAHDLRHRFGYVMAACTSLPYLSQIMGHDSVNTTMLYYRPGYEQPEPAHVEGALAVAQSD
ncbi:tyrosine-type recombinase/integrase [Paenibacillus sp. IB182496]|uniref:Tyrosine-type recombinase/integrase n=1 Tax=Paenibacillus sabuli TaxID=2772509 RepID=A0A927BXC2_9BACL|nr:tyrosine-type recombinase/integrase [Paenibacillus sabuli]MBD2848607.1 tyrosine-type recombinase/integrase [Paenibacillus sabuli]